MTTAILIAALTLSAAPEIRVETLSGPAVVGSLVALDRNSIVVATDDSKTSVAVERILRVQLLPGVPNEPAAPWIELRDGSVIPVVEFTVQNEVASLTLSGTRETISVPIDEVRVVHFLPPTFKTKAEWRELRLTPQPADLLVVRRDDAIDYLTGLLGDITDTEVVFKLDGDEIPVPKRRIDGLLYYRGVSSDLASSLCILATNDGLRLIVGQLEFSGDHFRTTTVTGVQFSIPVQSVTSIDFSSSKLRYLSELEPRSQTVVPLIGLPNRSVVLEEAEKPLVDRGFYSNKLSIRTPIIRRGRRTWKVATYDRGLALRSRTELEYQVPNQFRRFVAVAGIDAALGGRGEVRLIIKADGKTVFDELVRGASEAIALDLDIFGAKRLTIVVGFGDHGDSGDRLYLCDARITK